MPKLKETIAAVTEKITGATPIAIPEDEIDAALERQRDAIAKGIDIARDLTEARRSVDAADVRLGDAVDDDDLYEAAKAELAAAKDRLERLHHKRRANEREQAAAQKALDVLAAKRVESACRRKMNARVKYAKRLTELYDEVGHTWRLFHQNTGELVAALPPGTETEGGLVRHAEIEQAIGLQLARSHTVDPTVPSVAPPLPGAAMNPLLDTKKLPRFDDLVRQADEYLLRLVEARGRPDPVPAPQPESVPQRPQGPTNLNGTEEMPRGPTHSAASIPIKRITLYDDSEGRVSK